VAQSGRERSGAALTWRHTDPAEIGWVKSDRQLDRERDQRRRSMRAVSVASVSTVVLGLLLAWVMANSPGWPRVQQAFFSWRQAKAALPSVASGLLLNVELFLTAEPLILLVGLAVAVTRTLRSPVTFPLRVVAVAYTDVFRGVPTLLVVFLVGFGLPALNLQGTPTSLFQLALIALVLSYGAYVAEVFRAGIDSIHPSQLASARSLGLTYGQALRHVVLPQAIRRVIPPLLNDFISLQKDTALVAAIGMVDALNAANIYASTNFNYTPYLVAAAFFVAMTVPLARFNDVLAARARRRMLGTPR
jgi:polar amino acid transport system permease protein